MSSSDMQGIKHDTGKPRIGLIPREAILALADILTDGAERYGSGNWETGFGYERIFNALQRHLWAWWSGEDLDPDSGKSHLHHALCNLVFLVTFCARGTGTDDRRRVDDN